MTAPARTRPRVHTQRPTAGGTRSHTKRPIRARQTERQRTNTRARTAQALEADTRGRTSAAQKAYAKRAQRTQSVRASSGSGGAKGARGVLSMLRLRVPTSRASFVVLIMALLTGGVALTLWLSTQAIADSYRLESVRAETAGLAERAERLQRDVARQESAAALAEKARSLGMIPSGEPARLLVPENGKPKLVGEPKVAVRPVAPAPKPKPTPKPAPVERGEQQQNDDGDREQSRQPEEGAGEDARAQAAAAPAAGETGDAEEAGE